MRDQRINELRDWLFQPAKEDEIGVYIWSRENDTEDISAAYALRKSGQRFVPVLSKTDGTLVGDVAFSIPPRPGDSGIIYVPRLSMHLNLRDNYREDGQVVEVLMPFLTSGWGEHDLALRISPEGAEKLDVVCWPVCCASASTPASTGKTSGSSKSSGSKAPYRSA